MTSVPASSAGRDGAVDQDGAAGAEDLNAGERALEHRGLLALWFVRLRLEEELDRSRRAGHQLSVVVLGPKTNDVSAEALAAAAAAVKASSRKADLIGWLTDQIIVVVLPDGDEVGTRHAAGRWKNQIWLKTMHMGAVRWESFTINDAARHASADAVFEVATRGLQTSVAPRGWMERSA